jgi:hypothetical protein
MSNSHLFCVVKWVEDPPKWDVFSVKAIKGVAQVGKIVKAPWGGDFLNALVIAVGK